MKYNVIGKQTFDTYPDGNFDNKVFDTEKEANEYIKNNYDKIGSVNGRYKVSRNYVIQVLED